MDVNARRFLLRSLTMRSASSIHFINPGILKTMTPTLSTI